MAVEDQRMRWSSRSAFILASIGAAVGLGNIWRFPWLSFKFGGGVFLIPYLLALFLVGLPMLMVELGLGRMMQRGDVEAFGKIHRRARGVGVTSIIGGFLVATYYVAIISWSLVYFIGSFESPLPWDGKEEEFFFDDVLHMADKEQVDAAKSEVIAGWVYGGLVFIWVTLYLVLAAGVKGVGALVKFTVPIPILLIVVMLIHNSTLEGAGDGVKAYVGEWDTSGLKGGVWPAAVGQIFFSIGIAFGIMTAYGSYNPESSDIVMDNCIIALSNSAISFVAGFAVYTILGNIAFKRGISVKEAGDVKGVALSFITYPAAAASLPGEWSRAMSIFFFFTLFTLGIDSALSMIEGVVTVLKDSQRFRHIPHSTIAGYVCIAGFLGSTLFATDLGLSLLDVCDHYINTYGIMMTGLAEAVTVSWVFGYKDTAERVGDLSAKIFTFGYFGAVGLGVILSGSLYDAMENEGYLQVGIPIGFVAWVASIIAAYRFRNRPSMSFLGWVRHVGAAGTEKVRHAINESAEKHNRTKLPIVWDIIIKYLIPPMLTGLLVNAAIVDAVDTETDFYNYPVWEHVIGISILAIMILALTGSIVFPQFWERSFGEGEVKPVVEVRLAMASESQEYNNNGASELMVVGAKAGKDGV
ncbi:hypothetical protein BSKO_04867 [Bryopsis sp. KO-2023]|nr:hypothetical protein BSKO_04867 [Bryopsis sp. KO-2023]